MFEVGDRVTSVADLRKALKRLNDDWYLIKNRTGNLTVLNERGEYIGYFEMNAGSGKLTLFRKTNGRL